MQYSKIIEVNKRNDNGSKIMVSVDLDMWWHCRWATGSPKAKWKDTKSLLKDHYGSEKPSNELVVYTNKLLEILDKFNIKATFFILGEVATYYPGLVKAVTREGHEIACHGWYHVDMTMIERGEFCHQVGNAKKLLEDLTGQEVLGFRAPNLITTSWLAEEIVNLGFIYDSSVCPSRTFFGKYSGMSSMPNNPFVMDIETSRSGNNNLVEIPITVMPYVRVPACSGIITRVLGKTWTKVALFLALKKGDSMYYFHPYEIGERPFLKDESFYIKLFMCNIGESFIKMLTNIFRKSERVGTILAKDVALKLLNKF